MPLSETQAEAARRLYTSRAAGYEASWHPGFSRRLVSLIPLQQGDRVLDLACGTGLDAVLAAERVGDNGQVIGIDITETMLAEAQRKIDADPVLSRRLTLVHHDIADLTNCQLVKPESFDVAICSSAFVLLEHPDQILAHWRRYLKPGGRLLLDIPHEHGLRAGAILEQVALTMGLPFPSHRAWVTSQDSARLILEQEGFHIERMETLHRDEGGTVAYLDLDQADASFDYVVKGPVAAAFSTEELRARARQHFKELWRAAAVNGQVEDSDLVYVYLAVKTGVETSLS